MGVELHITRAELRWDSEESPISADEWLAYVASDAELKLDPRNGTYFALWSGPSAYEAPWLDWFRDCISTKWPDTALYRKMLGIAAALGGRVQDDDGTTYPDEAQWEFDPRHK